MSQGIPVLLGWMPPAGATGTTAALAGVLRNTQRLTAVLTTVVALTGTVRQTERLNAQMVTAVPIAGTVRQTERLTGQLSFNVSLSGTVVNSQRLTGQVATAQALAGSIRQTERLTGNLVHSVALQGVVRNSQRLLGGFDAVAVLQGIVRQSSRLSGVLATNVALAGTIREAERLTGSLGTSVPIAGVIRNTQRLTGNVTGDVSLSGSIRNTQRLSGNLTQAVALAGVARDTQRLLGQLSTLVPIQGTIRQGARLQSNINFNVGVTLQGIIRQYSRLSGNITAYAVVGPYDNEIVDSQVDIEDSKAIIPAGLSSTARPGALTFDYRQAFTLGPETIGTADTGILGWAWYVTVDNGVVRYARSNAAYDGWDGENELFSYAGAYITEIDCAFEQNGRIVVVAERPTGAGGAAEVWLYWYKPSLGAFTFEMIDSGRNPRIVLDNPNDTTISDVHIAYMKDGSGLVTRRQSELYTPARATVFTASSGWFLEEFARNRGNRLVAIVSGRVGDRYYLDRIESTLYPIYPSDGMTLGARVLVTSTLDTLLLTDDLEVDSAELDAEVLNTSTLSLVLMTHTLYDTDGAELDAEVLTASTLTVVLTEHTLYDKDGAEIDAEVLTSSDLVVVLITDSTDEDEDQIALSATVQNTSTLEVP